MIRLVAACLLLTACAMPVRVDPSSVLRVEIANAPTAQGSAAPLVIAATGSAVISGSDGSGTFAGQVVFDAGRDEAAPPPQPAPGPDWLGLILSALGLAAGGSGLAIWVARAVAVARLVSNAREAYAEDMTELARKNDPDLAKEVQMRHRHEQEQRGIHRRVQKARGKPIP